MVAEKRNRTKGAVSIAGRQSRRAAGFVSCYPRGAISAT